MKRLHYIVFILVLIGLSCNKPPITPQLQDVVFQTTAKSNGFKSSTCDNPIANYALIEIDGITHQVDIFHLNGKIFTKIIKLTPGNHTLGMFVLVNDGGDPNNPSTDVIVFAAPLSGSNYAHFVSKPLLFSFTVVAFDKTEVPIELLCFEIADYENFGFTWYTIEDIIVREFCFLGSFCTEDYLEYAGSSYEYQLNGLQPIMPAIFRIDLYRNDVFLLGYDNENWYGENRSLCVKYPDYLNSTDTFKFILWILVKEGEEFVYKNFYIWTTTDANDLPDIGVDGIMEFVLGNCNPDADLILPPYDNPTPEPEPFEETAYAYDNNGLAICFDTITEITSTNWGFSNGPYNQSENSYTLKLYAGAGGCILSNGYHVGDLILSYNTSGEVTVTYNLYQGYTLGELHLYIGETYYQIGNEAAAPGLFPYKDDASGTSTYTFTLTDIFTGHIYIIAHADINST